MRFKELVLLLAGVVLGLFGLLMILGASLNWAESENPTGDIMLGLGLGLLPLAASVYMVTTAMRRSSRRKREKLERDILNLAAASGGRLTPPQVAKDTDLTLAESKAALDGMHLSGHCHADLGSDGSITYRFTS